jgi:hypothetical protein
MTNRSIHLAAAISAIVLAACGAAPGSPVVAPTGLPVATETAIPSPTVKASVGTPFPEPTLEPPPVARLISGGRSFRGTIGSYSWKTHGDAAPWLPATALVAIDVTAGARVSVKLDRAPIAGWTAGMARANDTTGHDLTPLGDGHGGISFSAPRSGSWVVLVSIRYAGDLGDGSYYWRLDVR